MKNPEVKGQLLLTLFLRDLVLWCDSSTCSTLQREAARELFSTLVNKYTDGMLFEPVGDILRHNLLFRCF